MERRKRLLARVACSTLCLVAARVAAFDKMECVRAHEFAQEFRKAGDIRGREEQLAICASASCPRLVQEDCRLWLDEGAKTVQPPVGHSGAEAAAPPPGASSELETLPPVTESLNRSGGNGEHGAEQRSESPSQHASSWVPPLLLGSAAGMALVAGAYLGLSGRSSASDLRESCAPACNPSDVSTVRTRLVVADLTMLTGALCAGATAWVLWDKPAPPHASFSSSPSSPSSSSASSAKSPSTTVDGLTASVSSGHFHLGYAGHF